MSNDSNEYEVGFRKPPKANQFKKGQSGNLKGRPKGARGVKTDLLEVMGERLSITQNGKTQKISSQMVILKALRNKAVKGDVRAASKLIDMVGDMFGDDHGSVTAPASLSDNDENLLESYLQERIEMERKNGV